MKRNLSQWLAYLESLHPKGQSGIELGLDRVGRVKAKLVQGASCPVIVVGGTNGKGSTCAYLEAIYRAAGYCVGCYTSPHLLVYNERVRVDGSSIDDAALCVAFERVEAARVAAGDVFLTYFEFGTLAAWEVFAARNVEVAILEVGLGGRLDAVNIYDADCAIVTGVALDHTDWLGPTREHIGGEKAGIFRTGKPAICADRQPPQSLLQHAESIGADLRLIGRDFDGLPSADTWTYISPNVEARALARPALVGDFQLGNAAAAMNAVVSLSNRLPVDFARIGTALASVSLAGRFQVLPDRPERIFDVAHNPQAAIGLAASLSARPVKGKTIAVIGMLADKDIAAVLVAVAACIDVWFFATLEGPRGTTATTLQDIHHANHLGGATACFATVADALAAAAKLAGEDDRIAVFGSFHTVAACLQPLAEGA